MQNKDIKVHQMLILYSNGIRKDKLTQLKSMIFVERRNNWVVMMQNLLFPKQRFLGKLLTDRISV